jgi:transcriptional regulator with XRE-family HTH domain
LLLPNFGGAQQMTRSIHSEDYDRLKSLLVEAREAAGLSQYDVAEHLNRPQSFVSKYERGERRLDVIEFLEVAHALSANPFTLLLGLNLVVNPVGDDQATQIKKPTILDQWSISPEELTILAVDNPSLRGILLGYIAELKFRETWLNHPDITSSFKHDDHSRKGKGDRVITFRGHEFVFEVKSLQTNSIRRNSDGWTAQAQVDASDRRNVVFSDGSCVQTTCLRVGEFDILAVNIFSIDQKWEFVFAKNSDLPRSTSKIYNELQKSELLKSSVKIFFPLQHPFTDDPYHLLEEIIEERSKVERISLSSDLR